MLGFPTPTWPANWCRPRSGPGMAAVICPSRCPSMRASTRATRSSFAKNAVEKCHATQKYPKRREIFLTFLSCLSNDSNVIQLIQFCVFQFILNVPSRAPKPIPPTANQLRIQCIPPFIEMVLFSWERAYQPNIWLQFDYMKQMDSDGFKWIQTDSMHWTIKQSDFTVKSKVRPLNPAANSSAKHWLEIVSVWPPPQCIDNMIGVHQRLKKWFPRFFCLN